MRREENEEMYNKSVILQEKEVCPFCASNDIKCEQDTQPNGIKVWACWCGNCGAMGPTDLGWSGALEMWNLRRLQKQQREALEEIESLGWRKQRQRSERTMLGKNDVVDLLERRVKVLGSQKELAKEADISEQYLSDVLRSRRDPGKAILDHLGLKKKVVYVTNATEAAPPAGAGSEQ